MNRQKLRDTALLLPALGLVLVMPPFVDLFSGPDTGTGVPPLVIYIFAVWATLIVLGAILARRLSRIEPPPAQRREPSDMLVSAKGRDDADA